MKYSPKFIYTFTPASSTLDLSAAANGFAIKGLLAVVNATAQATIYAIGTSALGYSTLTGGNVLVLQASMAGMASTDNLIFFYDDGNVGLTASGTAIGARPDGFLNVKLDPSPLLSDSFESLDTTSVWTTGGTVTPTVTSGNLSCPPGTTASSSSYVKSQAFFRNAVASFLQYVAVVQFEAGVVIGSQRFWGLGILATPTALAPVSSGVIFEIDDVAGALMGSVYSAGTRTQSVVLTRPTDAAAHRYSFYFRTSQVYFEIDGVTVGTINYPNLAVNVMNLVVGSVNRTSALATAPVLLTSFQGIGDTGRPSLQISDGLYPWNKGTVKPASVAAAATDTALVVSLSPNSPISAPAITKGTQGSTGLMVQDLKDAGRTAITAFAESASGSTTDTLFSLQISSGFGTIVASTNYTVPAGKTLRLTSLTIAIGSTGTTMNATRVRLRVNPTGAALISSTIIWSGRIGFSTATVAANQFETITLTFPDGLEIPSGAGLAASHVEIGASGTIDLSFSGFIY